MESRNRIGLRLLTLTVSLLLIGSRAYSLPYVKKPIPSGPTAKTAQTWNPIYHKFYQREVVEAYRKNGFHDPKWDADAIAFLTHFTKMDYAVGRPETKSFFEEGKALIDAGCNDPMVLSAYGGILFEEGRKVEAELPLERAIEGFKKSKYHKCRARYSPLNLAKIREANGKAKAEDVRQLFDLALEWTLDSFQDGSYQNGEQRLALENFCDNYQNDLTIFRNSWRDVLAALEKKRPTDPYLDKVARGKCHNWVGWEARGGGYAYKVTDEGWKVFGKEQAIARKLLTEAWKSRPEFPQAPYEMIGVARADGAPGEIRMWFDRTVAAQIDFMYAYQAVRFSLSKMWWDDPDGIYELGIECVKTGRFDTMVPAQFIACLNDVSANIGNSCWTDPKTAKYMDIMYAGYAKSGRIGNKESVESQEAAVAWCCKRYGRCRDIIVKLGDKLDQTAFTRITSLSFPEIKGEIFALASAHGSELVKANDLIAKKPAAALAIYEKAYKKPLGDSLADAYIEEQTQKLRIASAMATGDWAELSFSQLEKDWTVGGPWKFGDDLWLRIPPNASGDHTLKSKSVFLQAMQVEVELNFGDAVKTRAVAIGFLPLDVSGASWYIAQVSRTKKQVDIKEFNKSLVLTSDVDVPQVCKLRMEIWAGIVNIYLDDKPIKLGYRVNTPLGVDGRCRVVITSQGNFDETSVGIRNVRVRKLTAKPAGMEKVEVYDMNAVRKQLNLD